MPDTRRRGAVGFAAPGTVQRAGRWADTWPAAGAGATAAVASVFRQRGYAAFAAALPTDRRNTFRFANKFLSLLTSGDAQ